MLFPYWLDKIGLTVKGEDGQHDKDFHRAYDFFCDIQARFRISGGMGECAAGGAVFSRIYVANTATGTERGSANVCRWSLIRSISCNVSAVK